jgi:C4-dicarboxylate-specific signal transduction histidine kinase
VIRELIEFTRAEAMRNSVYVKTELADDLPGVSGDGIRLREVILNLMMNAIEAMSETSEGFREMQVSTAQTPSGDLLVEVRDSGPGLPPNKFYQPFETFYTTKPGGLGIGLSICRSIVEAHGGRLLASANVPRGAI